MALLVVKFGSTSAGSIDRIKFAASKVSQEIRRGHQIVVVVSAMAGVRKKLIDFCRNIGQYSNPREYDVVISTGEQASAGLMALALEQRGLTARSYLGWQLPIQTNAAYSNARIQNVDVSLLETSLKRGETPVLASFQGVTEDHSITTLGEGGDDTSAVSIAAALKADRCDIYSDVKGLYTAAPHLVHNATRISRLSYKEVLEMAALGTEGAALLEPRAIEIGLRYHLPIQILSTFENTIGSDLPGTLIKTEDKMMETNPVTGIAHSRKHAKITLASIPDRPGIAAHIFTTVARAGINVDAIVQSSSSDGKKTDVSFTVPKENAEQAATLLSAEKEKIGFAKLETDKNIAKISLVGLGMREKPGVAALMFKTLAEKGINIKVVETSEITTSVLISEDYLELALRALHEAFALENIE